LQSYYDANNYQFYSNLYQALVDSDVKLEDAYHIKAAYIYLWDGRYQPSKDALNNLAEENNIDEAKIRADICYYSGDYKCAAQYYEKLYNTSYEIEYAVKLINSYIYLGQTQKAQRLYNYIYRKYPKNVELKKLGVKLSEIQNSYILNRQKEYESDKNDTTLENYTTALYAEGKVKETLSVLSDYNQEHATGKSLLLEAKYLIWSGESQKALEILKKDDLTSDLDAKLMMGQIYSWEQKFEESKKYLNEVIAKSTDKTMLYKAKKARAYVSMWEKEDEFAKRAFQALNQENPGDKEVSEALMELNHDYAGLILIYKNRIKSESTPYNLKRLSELYVGNKEPKKAIGYLKNYVDVNPSDLEATKDLAVLLIENKEYYQGFGYLEYYAAQKQNAQSTLLLAKNYYWSGFSKEALDVLDGLLKKEPQNEEALKLKAQILKISPRFTTSNSGATVNMYYDDLGAKQLEIADALYFNSHYKASLMYYENYLKNNPTNHEVRYRYAFALENAGEYGKAEGEFALMFWTKDSDELRYHYAYNLMKNNKTKEAKEMFAKLQKSTYQTISPTLDAFLQKWKKDWESLNYNAYAQHYNADFTKNQVWAYKKQSIFSNVNYIAVGIYDPVYKSLEQENSYEIRFYQEYATNKKSDKGYKTLRVECAANQSECKIINEKWEKGEYEKSLILTPYIDQGIQEIERIQKEPLSFNVKSKKKNSIPELAPKKYHDIVLAPGLDKDYIDESTFDEIYTISQSANVYKQYMLASSRPSKLNELVGKLYYFEDSGGIVFESADLFYRRNRVTENLDFGVDGGLFSIEEKGVNKYNGIRYGASLFYNHFIFRLGMNQYDDFSEIVPTVKYLNSYNEHSYVLEYTHQNALFYTYRLAPYEKRITADHFSITDYALFEDKTSLWANLELNSFSNGDFEITPQFDWRFYHDTAFTPNFTYDVGVEGWYTAHTKQHDDFYSPDFYDLTLLRVDPQYIFSKYLGIRGKLGLGYSIVGQDFIYKYGAWIFGEPLEDLHYSAGCLKNNTAKTSSGEGYYYTECEAELGYKW
ncbi:MAG: tetratricopeptide repeat protein, partial [Epsilonproteobacteria bacterium]|nr:tetratricopeptide repeat protein [Campylobacterota bacterium]